MTAGFVVTDRGATAEITVPVTGRTVLRLRMGAGQITALPAACVSSTVVRQKSYLSEDGT